MLKTQNYELNKPEYNNVADIFPAVDENMDLIDKIMFDKLNKTDLPRENVYCGLTTGNATTYTAKASPTLLAYKDGMFVTIIPHIDCSNNPTLAIDGLGAYSLKNANGDNLAAGEMKANIPYVFVRVGSSFFMRNGSNNKSIFDDISVYGNNLYRWFGKQMPTARFDFDWIIYEDKIYCFGGTAGSSQDATHYYEETKLVDLEILDIKTNTWEVCPKLNFTIADGSYIKSYIDKGLGILMYNNKPCLTVHTVTITNKADGPDKVYKQYLYDIESKTWSKCADDIQYCPGNLIHEGKIYNLSNTECLEYDMLSGTKTKIPSPPNHLGKMVLSDNKIYSIKKNTVTTYSANIQVLDLKLKTWTSWDMNTDYILDMLDYEFVGIYNSRLFVAGGILGGASVNGSIYSYDLKSGNRIDGGIFLPCFSGAYCTYKDKLICIGGRGNPSQTGYTTSTVFTAAPNLNGVSIVDMNI